MSSLPAIMKRIRLKTAEKKWRHHFLHHNPICYHGNPAGSGRISNSSKLSCMLSLPASMKRIRLRTAEKKWRHHFSHYKHMGIISDFQGQLTLQSVVQSGGNLNLSELSCMSSLPAIMKRIRLKTAEKKWRHHFPHHNPFCYHGNQRLDLAEFQTHPSSHVCYHYLQV